MNRPIDITSFLELRSGERLVLDVRSPKEFAHAHVPGAINLPLLNDEERHIVGITYKEDGRDMAVRKGFELAGPRFASYIDFVRPLVRDKDLLVYCWRGGMRSQTMAWILGLAGFQAGVLEGGYKTFRRWVLQELQTPKQVVVLAGKTGTGKTDLLDRLLKNGEQVIQLEYLANHKGSTYGALGQPPQPSMEQFENYLADQWRLTSPDKPLWLEDESRWIGSIKIPDKVFAQMRQCPVVEMRRSRENRTKRILKEYGHFPVDLLEERTLLLARRMGGERVKAAIELLRSGDLAGWIALLLDYYDQSYSFGLEKRKTEDIYPLELGHCSDDEAVAALLKYRNELGSRLSPEKNFFHP